MKGKITPTRTYRLPKRTLDELQMLVEKEIARNTTEAIIIAIEHLATEYGLGREIGKRRQKPEEPVVMKGPKHSIEG